MSAYSLSLWNPYLSQQKPRYRYMHQFGCWWRKGTLGIYRVKGGRCELDGLYGDQW